MNIFKIFVCFGLLLECDLVASNYGAIEMAPVVRQPSANTGNENPHESVSQCNNCSSKSADACKSRKCTQIPFALTALVVVGLTGLLSYDPHTYQVYNRYSDTIYLSYRPGCANEEGEVDCVKRVNPGGHAVIDVPSCLTKLCVMGNNCATIKGIEHNYTWNVHNHSGGVSFGRGKFPSKSQPENSAASSAEIHKDYLKIRSKLPETESIQPRLRGSIK